MLGHSGFLGASECSGEHGLAATPGQLRAGQARDKPKYVPVRGLPVWVNSGRCERMNGGDPSLRMSGPKLQRPQFRGLHWYLKHAAAGHDPRLGLERLPAGEQAFHLLDEGRFLKSGREKEADQARGLEHALLSLVACDPAVARNDDPGPLGAKGYDPFSISDTGTEPLPEVDDLMATNKERRE